MTLAEFLKTHEPELTPEYDIQVNYKPIEAEDYGFVILEDEDIVRVSKPFETPRQYVIGENDDENE